MKFDKIGIQGTIVRFADLENVMQTVEMIRGGQWDYERVTYDHKFENRDTGDIYYLRLQGAAVKGEFENPDTEVELLTPILGHHYYPHGVEYDEEFPDVLVKKCTQKLEQLKELLEDVQLVKTESVNAENVTQQLLGLSGVENIANLHIWSDESGAPVVSCHLIVETDRNHDAILKEATDLLREQYNVEHSTIQIDRESAEPAKNES